MLINCSRLQLLPKEVPQMQNFTEKEGGCSLFLFIYGLQQIIIISDLNALALYKNYPVRTLSLNLRSEIQWKKNLASLLFPRMQNYTEKETSMLNHSKVDLRDFSKRPPLPPPPWGVQVIRNQRPKNTPI